MKDSGTKKIWLRRAAIVVLAFVNALSISYITEITDPNRVFFGTEIYGWNPSCIAFFALDIILLNRFFTKEVIKDKRRIILSAIPGWLLSLGSVWAAFMVFGNNSLLVKGTTILISIPLSIGMALFVIPLFSELFGFFNKISNDKKEEKPGILVKKPWLAFVIIWAVIFISFVPILLYWWPVNFVYDADDQIYTYMSNSMSTHHSILHTLFLGKAYEWGYNRGDVNSGMIFYSLIQMFILSGSEAFFMEYLYEKKVKKALRLAALFVFLFNPVNSWFAVSTIKGVLSAAFIVVALTFFLRFIDDKSKGVAKKIAFGIGTAVFLVLSCHFRNNMIYAVAAGGIIAVLLQKGLKKKLVLLGVILATILCFKGTEKLLIKTTGAYVKDTQRESMSVPLMCLARVAVYHRDELTDLEYNEILAYIPEDSLQNYSYVISDGIKNIANENLLKNNKSNFLKLVAKIGLKHPVEYIETFVGLTAGYYYPFDYPYFLGGTTKLFTEPIYGDYPMVENKNILPFGTVIMDYLFKDTDGRLRVPLLGWFWKSTVYVWGYIFTFFYLLYRKDKKGISVMIIPLMYLATCFFGPVSWMRYIYINIATMPVITYLCTHSGKNK
ncbi:MAG: hypothetical protein J6X97_08510 [Lachnospiraceae bacterium]|nr:hypothetical protein [Lachnospiraceae bacterium]